jgi:hypothetical protein
MCMMCDEAAMYEAYLEYLARRAARGEDGAASSGEGRLVCEPAAEEGTVPQEGPPPSPERR